MYYLLVYKLSDDYLERRSKFRPAHFELAQAARERGELLLGGALADPADQALILFNNEESARTFAENDPYVDGGLVQSWEVRPWTLVIGAGVPALVPPSVS